MNTERITELRKGWEAEENIAHIHGWDFSHIHDIYKKIENIEKEGIFDYLVLSDYKYKDREYLLNYEGKTLKILLFEED